MKQKLLWALLMTISTSLYSQRAFIQMSNEQNIISNWTEFDNDLTNQKPDLALQITKTWNPAGVDYGYKNDEETGLWYTGGNWVIYNEAKTDMKPKLAHNVFVPKEGGNAYVHHSVDTTISSNYTYLYHADLNNNPSALVFVTHNWAASGIYNESPFGVWYTGANWAVFNQGLSAMSENIAYNIYIPAENDIAFVHTATVENISGTYTYIDNEATNSNENAVLIVTQNWNPGGIGGVYNNNSIGVWYNDTKEQWVIFNQSGAMPENASFNVLVADKGNAATLPDVWTTSDIGNPRFNGFVNYADGKFLVEASGQDIWDDKDEFSYVYQEIPEDAEVEIIAKVASLDKADPWTKAGIMIRQSINSDSPNVLAAVSSENGTLLSERNSIGGFTSSTEGPDLDAPAWVRLVKLEDTITSYASENGSTWEEIGSSTLELSGAYNVGLAVSAHHDSLFGTAIFDSVEVIIDTPEEEASSIANGVAVGNSTLTLAPNPSVDIANVSFITNGTNAVNLNIYSLEGKLIKTIASEVFQKGEHTLQIDISDLKEGMYIVNMVSNNTQTSQKLFKISE